MTASETPGRVPEHAARIETPAEIFDRVRLGKVGQEPIDDLVAVIIDRDQIRRALGLALIGADEMPRECLARVREVLEKLGGPL